MVEGQPDVWLTEIAALDSQVELPAETTTTVSLITPADCNGRWTTTDLGWTVVLEIDGTTVEGNAKYSGASLYADGGKRNSI